jgi:hypothetical protein
MPVVIGSHASVVMACLTLNVMADFSKTSQKRLMPASIQIPLEHFVSR